MSRFYFVLLFWDILSVTYLRAFKIWSITVRSLYPLIIKGLAQFWNIRSELREVRCVYSSSFETIHGFTPLRTMSSTATLFLRWIGFYTPSTPKISSWIEVKLYNKLSSFTFSLVYWIPSLIVMINWFVSSTVSYLLA